MENKIVNDAEFKKHHRRQIQIRSQKDVFFVWMLIVFISVIAAHFVLNFTGSTPTGFVTATQDPASNATLFLGAMLTVFIVIMIIALIHIGVTRVDD